MGSMLYRNVLWDCFAKPKLTHFPVQPRHRDLWIWGRERPWLRVRDLTSTFFAYFSQERDTPESFTLLVVHQKPALLSLLKEVKPSSIRKVTKLLTLDNLIPQLLSFGSVSNLWCLDAPAVLPPPSRGSTAEASRHQRLETEPILSIDRSRSRPRLRI